MPILCATDFAPSSRAATQVAAALARRLQRKLLLVHATEPPPIALPEATVGVEAWEAAIQEAAEAELEKMAADLAREGVEAEAVAAVGAPQTVIQEVSAEQAPELVVIGTHGRKGASRFFLGSVAERIVRGSRVPVLVVPEGATCAPSWQESPSLQLLAVADGSLAGHAAWAWALALEKILGPRVRSEVGLLRLFWPHQEAHRYGLDLDWHPGDAPPVLVPLLERDLRHELEALGHGDAASALVLRPASRDAAHDVMAEAAARRADAIVIGIGRGRPHLLPGPALRPGALLRAASLPILCVPQAAAPVEESLPPVRTALVATDLSDDSHEAIRTAYRLMKGPGQRVELCHVVQRGPVGDGIDLPFAPPLSAPERAALESRLRALIPAGAPASGITTHVALLEGGTAAETLLQAAARVEADLIVLAFHGRTGPSRLIYGSVAEEIARRSPRPVLLVHPR